MTISISSNLITVILAALPSYRVGDWIIPNSVIAKRVADIRHLFSLH